VGGHPAARQAPPRCSRGGAALGDGGGKLQEAGQEGQGSAGDL